MTLEKWRWACRVWQLYPLVRVVHASRLPGSRYRLSQSVDAVSRVPSRPTQDLNHFIASQKSFQNQIIVWHLGGGGWVPSRHKCSLNIMLFLENPRKASNRSVPRRKFIGRWLWDEKHATRTPISSYRLRARDGAAARYVQSQCNFRLDPVQTRGQKVAVIPRRGGAAWRPPPGRTSRSYNENIAEIRRGSAECKKVLPQRIWAMREEELREALQEALQEAPEDRSGRRISALPGPSPPHERVLQALSIAPSQDHQCWPG